jgi:hypothetical protein
VFSPGRTGGGLGTAAEARNFRLAFPALECAVLNGTGPMAEAKDPVPEVGSGF